MKNRKKIITILIMFTIIFTMIGGSLADWNYQTLENQKTNVVFTSERGFSCAADGGGVIDSSSIIMMPTSCTNSEQALQREITVTAKIDGPQTTASMELWLNIDKLDSGLSNSTKFRYALTTEPDNCQDNIVSSGSFSGKTVGEKVQILSKDYSSTTIETYYLYIWLDKSETSLETVNQNFEFSLSGSCIDVKKTAYAVYSADDNSLTFYKTLETITVGDTYNGKTATAVYTGFETTAYSSKEAIPWFEYREIITSVAFEDTISPISTDHWFRGFTSCVNMELKKLDTSKVTSMYRMFHDCSSLTSLDLSNFNTSNVTNMYHMFEGLQLETIDVSTFDTRKVTNMDGMFNNNSNLIELDLSTFNTSKVTTMVDMFRECPNLSKLNISNFDTSKVTHMNYMFYNCTNLIELDLSSFDTSNVTNMQGMLAGIDSLTNLDLSNFNTSNVTDMSWMFNMSNNLKSLNVSSFNTSKVTKMQGMFGNLNNLEELDVSNFDTSNVETMHGMFGELWKINELDLSNFDTSKVTTTYGMFSNNQKLKTLKLNNASFTNVTDATDMFTVAVPKDIYIIAKDDTERNWLQDKLGEGKGTIVTVAELAQT